MPMDPFRSTFERREDGEFDVNLSTEERDALSRLPRELIEHLHDPGSDRSSYRLFPPAYSDDLGRQVEYDRLTRDDLTNRHIEALELLESTLAKKSVTEEELHAWIRAINQLRLVLGTRLNVTQDMPHRDFDENDPETYPYALYDYLGELQYEAISALSGDI